MSGRYPIHPSAITGSSHVGGAIAPAGLTGTGTTSKPVGSPSAFAICDSDENGLSLPSPRHPRARDVVGRGASAEARLRHGFARLLDTLGLFAAVARDLVREVVRGVQHVLGCSAAWLRVEIALQL
jgi:hypothetical protein